MIKINNLTKKFSNGVVAVDHLNIDIPDGVNGLVGENGAGKSTLFRLISGIYLPEEGTVNIDGHPSYSKEAKESLFFLCDDPLFNRGDSPLELYKFYSYFYDIDKENYLRILEALHLPIENKLQTYSKGMRRQTFIALSLSMKVKYLLLDEAFDGLDPLVLETIKDEIIKKGKESTIVISTHNIALLDKLADRFIILSRGRLANNESTKNVDKAENLIKYQLYFKEQLEKEDFEKAGIEVISFRKVGSIIHLVTKEETDIEQKISSIKKPIIMETIPLEQEETIKLLMRSAREGE